MKTVSRWGILSLILGLTTVGLLQIPQNNLSADLLNPTNSALPFMCSSISTASSNNAGGNSPGNLNYGISLWYGVGSVTPYSHLGPTGEELATISDSNVFEQRYVGTSPAVLAVGAADHIADQQITVTCDTGTIVGYTPEISNVNTNMRLYVAKDGSTYHSRADHNYATWPSPPDLTPEQALRPEHLAKASPTYQADCYNTAAATYSQWSCSNSTTRTRNKTTTGKSYNTATQSCDTDATPIITPETENCATGLMCVSNPPDAQGAVSGDCVQPSYTVDDDFNSSTSGWGTYKFSSLQVAMDSAPAGATININAGTYTGNFTASKTFTVQGAGANQVILDGNGSGTVFNITSSTGFSLTGVTVRNSGKGDGRTPGNVGIHVNPSFGIQTTYTYTIKDNAIYGNRNGLVLWNGLNANAVIQNNMILRNTDAGLDNSGFGQTTIINNTISDNGGNGYFDWVGKGPHTFKNNIIVYSGKYGFVTHRETKPMIQTYNNVWNNPLGNYMEGYSGPYTALTPTPGTGEMSVDPQFIDRSNADYRLSSTSSLIGKGEGGADIGSNVFIGAADLAPLTGATASSTALIPGNTNGLIGYWRFDGNGNNEVEGSPAALIVGNASFKTSGGQYDGYAYIPNTTDWLKIPYNGIFDLPETFTIEFWFRQRSEQGFAQNLIYKGNGPNNYNFNIFRQLWNQYNFGPIITGFTSTVTGYWVQASNPNQLAHNEWHHVVYTKSPTETAYYLDGVWIHGWNGDDSYQASMGQTAKTPSVDIIIGDSAVDTDIDNLRIYSRGMTKAEARSNGGFPPETEPAEAPTSSTTSGNTTSTTGTYAATSGTTAATTGTYTATTGTYTATTGTYTATTGTYTATTGTYTAITGTTTATPSTTGTSSTQTQNGTTSSQGTTAVNEPSTTLTGQQGSGAYPEPEPYSISAPTSDTWPTNPEASFLPVFDLTESGAPSTLTRSLTAAEATLSSFETFVTGLDASKVRQKMLDQAYDLMDEGIYYTQQIRRSISEGNLIQANRRLGLLQQVMTEIKRTWEILGRGKNTPLPTETFFNSENIIREELASYGMEEVADQIAKLIVEKINFAEIVNQVVKQSSELLNKLLAHSEKHEETVAKTIDLLVIVDEKFHDEYLEKKNEVLEVVDRFDERFVAFDEQKQVKSDILEKIETVKEKIVGYNFIGSTGEKMKTEIEKFIERFNDPNLNEVKLEEEIAKLNQSAEESILKAREEKFKQGAIPFKDTDDNEWFTAYVVPIQKEGIISGYKDAQGKSLGEFGPANNVTVAEILKIALESAGLGESEPFETFKGHWAAGYVTKGKELGLTLTKGVQTFESLNRPATRAEVVRVLLEVFDAAIEFGQTTTFEDAKGHKDEAYIEKARELEIISGYPDGSFRPNHFVNRAETAKIVNLVMTSL